MQQTMEPPTFAEEIDYRELQFGEVCINEEKSITNKTGVGNIPK